MSTNDISNDISTDGQGPALARVEDVEALADQLSASADALHKRIMAEIRKHKGAPISEAEQTVARTLLDEEMLLRQRANGLYADAATLIVASLSASQAQLMQLTTDAVEKIRKIDRLRNAAGLVGGLLMLAGAAATGQAAPIVVAIERVSKQIKIINASAPNKAA